MKESKGFLVGFYGPPASGKSTIAHAIFAALKKRNSIHLEFVSEYARRYIAKKKVWDRSPLDNFEQEKIMNSQAEEEIYFFKDNALTVTDSSTVNSCFYIENLSKDIRRIESEIKRYNLLFVTVFDEDFLSTLDTGRIHNLSECKRLNQEMFDTLNNIDSSIVAEKCVFLVGPSEVQVQNAISFIDQRMKTK